VTVNLKAGNASGADGNDTLVDIENARGSEYADTLIGSDGANDLQGRAGDDNIQGGGGNDTLHGGKGNDIIDGGEGQDVARFSGLFTPERYTVSIANGVVTITDSLEGGDGVDTLSNVERFQFSDGVYKLNTAGNALVPDAVEISSAIDGVNNFDVTSPIVLQASMPVSKGAGAIRIMNDGGTGFRGENGDNDQSIDVASAAVTIEGNLIIIRPPFDLDLANDYYIEIDAGAFVATSGGLGNLAVSDPTAVNFSTVAPGLGSIAGAPVPSVAANLSTGAMLSSFAWLDIQDMGSALQKAQIDIGASSVALVFHDRDTTFDPRTASEDELSDGIGAPGIDLVVSNFGPDDLLYIDNQNNSIPNDLSLSQFFPNSSTGVTRVSFNPFDSLGARIDIDTTSTAPFFGVEDLAQKINSLFPPIQSE